jgi:hypothetical protein
LRATEVLRSIRRETPSSSPSRPRPGAIAAALEAQEALAIPVRMGLHTGTPLLADEGYVGADVHRAARIAAAGHGGQVLVSAATAALLQDSLRDLGEHRLKDLSAPERIYQGGESDFPPLKTLYATNLPVPATPFLGRERELRETSSLLLDGVRLLTLSGPGGTGKTRLALQAAAAVADEYPDGIWWVPLVPLSDPALVLPAAGEALGAKGELQREIADKRLLLLLDNFEHAIDAAGEVAGLLGVCPKLTILVTSRERLQLAGEHEYAVPTMASSDGLELFSTRARGGWGRRSTETKLRASCASGSTTCRSRSNWPRRGQSCFHPRSCWSDSASGSTSSKAAVTPTRGSARSARPSSGPTTC